VKLLHLDSSIMGEGSASRAISKAVVERFRAENADIDVTYRDLAADPLPHMTLEIYQQLADGEAVKQFLESDVIVIGAGFYNFSIPSQLKSWIDRIAVPGKTFAYREGGPVSLVPGKKVVIALARGNTYGAESPRASFEHAETLLRSVFAFLGAEIDVVVAEGLGRGEEARRNAVDAAIDRAGRLHAGIAPPAALAPL